MKRAIDLVLIISLIGLSVTSLSGEIVIEGVADRDVKQSQVAFRVVGQAGATLRAELNGSPVGIDQTHTATEAGFYELTATRLDETGAIAETKLVRFTLLDPHRGSAEFGLYPWTPRPLVDSAVSEFEEAQLNVVAPARIPVGVTLPVVAFTRNQANARAGLNGNVAIQGDLQGSIRLKRGYGFTTLAPIGKAGVVSAEFAIASQMDQRNIVIESEPEWAIVDSDLEGDVIWPEESRIKILADLKIGAGATLRIGAGSILLLGSEVEITVEGTVLVEGTPGRPVLFAPSDPDKPWGGFTLWSAPASFEATSAIFTGSGGQHWWFVVHAIRGTHRMEQALVYLGQDASATLTDCFIIDNAGQAFHGENASLTLRRCLVARCQTTGQFNGGSVTIEDSALLDFPSDDSVYVDEDNDAIYFTFGEHRITDTLIGWTKDDGIDAGGNSPGMVTVERCWIEACFHEGLALSGTEKIVAVRDSVLVNCGQAVEAGYLSPRVTVETSLLLDNQVGARFGDNYARTHTGSLTMTDSIALHNDRDAWGFVRETWTEDLARMNLTDNLLTRADSLHPQNRAWLPESDGPKLASFRTTAQGPVAAAFPSNASIHSDGAGLHPISVHLSTFSSQPVELRYRVTESTGVVDLDYAPAEGLMTFLPGETTKDIALTILENPDRNIAMTLVLELDPVRNVELTTDAFRHTVTVLSPPTSISLIGREEQWRYLKGRAEASEPVELWRTVELVDASWSEGHAPFGYGVDNVTTKFVDMRTNYTSVFLRKLFELDLAEDVSSLSLEGRYDDGFIVWINGQEIDRIGIPGHFQPYNAKATESDFDPRDWTMTVSPSDLPSLNSGRNVIAVQVFNARTESSDLFFDLSVHAEMSGDSDGDELPDAWEQTIVDTLSSDPIASIFDVMPSDDYDGDTFSNRAELLAGTDPTNPMNFLRLSISNTSDLSHSLGFQGVAGRQYTVEYADELNSAALWQTLVVEPAQATNRPIEIEEAFSSPSRQRFYRLTVEHIGLNP